MKGFSESILSLFLNDAWPGNVRELENVVERRTILVRGDEVSPEDLPETLNASRNDYTTLHKAVESQLSLEEIEREYIQRILEQPHGAKFRTAKILGIDRKTLYRKLEQFKDKPPGAQ